MKIIIYGCKEGFNKVTFNKFLRSSLSYSIYDAKKIVEKIISGEKVILQIEYDEDFIGL